MGHFKGSKLQCWIVQAEAKVKQDLPTALSRFSQMLGIIVSPP